MKKSNGARIMRILAWICWVGGILVAIQQADVSSLGTYGYTGSEFDFVTFISTLVSYIVLGGVLYAIGELFDNVQGIRNDIKEMKNEMQTGADEKGVAHLLDAAHTAKQSAPDGSPKTAEEVPSAKIVKADPVRAEKGRAMLEKPQLLENVATIQEMYDCIAALCDEKYAPLLDDLGFYADREKFYSDESLKKKAIRKIKEFLEKA